MYSTSLLRSCDSADPVFYSPKSSLPIKARRREGTQNNGHCFTRCGDHGAYHTRAPPNKPNITADSTYRIASIGALGMGRGCKCRKALLGSLCTTRPTTNRWARDEDCRWEPGSAQIGRGIPFTAAMISDLGSPWPGLIGWRRSDGGYLAKLPKPCCGTSNKLRWRPIRPQGCCTEHLISNVSAAMEGRRSGLSCWAARYYIWSSP